MFMDILRSEIYRAAWNNCIVMTDIGFIGAGTMGVSLSRRLLAAGHTVMHLKDHDQDGNEMALESVVNIENISDFIHRSKVLITCLNDAAEVQTVADQIGPFLPSLHMWIDATTSDPAVSADIAASIQAHNCIFADAPVIGRPLEAERGELVSLVGCQREKFNQVKTVISAYSHLVQRFGDPGAGHTAKLLNDFVAESTSMLLIEAFDRARRAGVDWRALYDVMCVGPARSTALEQMLSPLLDGRSNDIQCSINNACKNMNYYRQLSAAMDGAPSVLADAVYEMVAAAAKEGRGQDDLSDLLDEDVITAAKLSHLRI